MSKLLQVLHDLHIKEMNLLENIKSTQAINTNRKKQHSRVSLEIIVQSDLPSGVNGMYPGGKTPFSVASPLGQLPALFRLLDRRPSSSARLNEVSSLIDIAIARRR